ncbi:MAG: electron transport complex subunit RsxE [Gammaproteobacteria bacterium]|nr:electron transport complex subunit RsxE [Gammaproteobacteria bacterium]
MAESLQAVVPATGAEQFQAGLWRQNPILVQALGMCPVLAVSNTAVNALTMGLATASVLLASALVISSLRRIIPAQVRLASFVLVIATFVTVTDMLIEAIAIDVHRALGAFIPLIVANCLILGRMEAHASRRPPTAAALDALGMGGGFVLCLLTLGSVRELLGNGSLFGIAVMPAGFEPWVVMLLPGGGFFALAGLVLAGRWLSRTPARQGVGP